MTSPKSISVSGFIRVAITLAALLIVASVCNAGWTGIRVGVGDPAGSWNGTSSCAPCNAFCDDLSEYVVGTSWRVGFTEHNPQGDPNHITIIRALPGEPTPYFEYVQDGRIVGRSVGYRGDAGEVRFLLSKYPGNLVTRVQGYTPYGFQSYIVPPYRGYEYAPSYPASYRGYSQTYTPAYANSYVPMQSSYRGVCVNGTCY